MEIEFTASYIDYMAEWARHPKATLNTAYVFLCLSVGYGLAWLLLESNEGAPMAYAFSLADGVMAAWTALSSRKRGENRWLLLVSIV